MKLQKLNLPKYEFKVKQNDNKYSIYDKYRQSYVALTPEEWVRQNFLSFLVEDRKFPEHFIKVEMKINLNNINKRCDSVVYDKQLRPIMILEFKSPEVTIDKETFKQITTYNFALGCRYLVISNGIKHYILIRDTENKKYKPINDIPDYEDLV